MSAPTRPPAISPLVCYLLPTLYLTTAPTLCLLLSALLPNQPTCLLPSPHPVPAYRTYPMSSTTCPPAVNLPVCYSLPAMFQPTNCLLIALKPTCLLPFSLLVTCPLLCLFLPTFKRVLSACCLPVLPLCISRLKLPVPSRLLTPQKGGGEGGARGEESWYKAFTPLNLKL